MFSIKKFCTGHFLEPMLIYHSASPPTCNYSFKLMKVSDPPLSANLDSYWLVGLVLPSIFHAEDRTGLNSFPNTLKW